MGMREATSAVAWPLSSFSPCQRPCPPDTPGPFLPPLRSPTHFPSHPPPSPPAPPLFRAWLPVFRRLWPPPALSGCTASHIPRLPSSPSPLATTPPSLSLSDLYSGSGLPLPTPEVILNDNLKNRVCAGCVHSESELLCPEPQQCWHVGGVLTTLPCSWAHNLVDTLMTRKWKLGSFVGCLIDPGAHFGTLLS